jgi:hypothetical protein
MNRGWIYSSLLCNQRDLYVGCSNVFHDFSLLPLMMMTTITISIRWPRSVVRDRSTYGGTRGCATLLSFEPGHRPSLFPNLPFQSPFVGIVQRSQNVSSAYPAALFLASPRRGAIALYPESCSPGSSPSIGSVFAGI